MYVNKVKGNCSMITIGENPNFGQISEKDFLQSLSDACNEANISKNGVKCVILTTNKNWIDRIDMLLLGFKRIGSYKGNSNDKAHIMMRTFPNGFFYHLVNYNKKRGTIKL